MIALVVLLSCITSVWSQDPLLVRYNSSVYINNAVDLRAIIYHDEIVRKDGSGGASPDGPGVLACRDAELDPLSGWRRPDGTVIPTTDNDNDFTQFRSTFSNQVRSELVQARDSLQDGASNNGLWTCHGRGRPHVRHVSIYDRGSGTIMVDSISVEASSSFVSPSPRFTLIANTSGGPPTTFSWRNNAGTITNGGSNSISLEVNPNNDTTGRMNCHYSSTLEVTAVAPGTYTYVADNRATSGDARMSFVVEGGAPSNLQVVQTGINMVELTWDPPPGPPAGGYEVQDAEMNIRTATSPSLTIDMLSPGEHTFQVTSPSRHFPGGTVGPETITVLGTPYTPVITLSERTATTVRVSWSSPPMFSFTVMEYDVAVRRITACSSALDRRGPRDIAAGVTTELFTDLDEYFDYTAEVTVNFMSPSSFTVSPVTVQLEFTTQSVAPSAVPSDVRVPTMTSRTVNVSWNAIDCRHQNGPNFRYEVELQRMDGGPSRVATVNGAVGSTVNDELFAVVGNLRPFTDYMVLVQAVNDEGSGDNSDAIVIRTNEDTPGNVADLNRVFTNFSSVNITWSPPQEPNGMIIAYELTYILNGTASMLENITDRFDFTINSDLGTVIEVRVRAYTSVGPGPIESIMVTLLPPTVMNIRVASVSDTSVRVTWDEITIPGITITQYIVYYSPVSSSRKRQNNEESVRVSGDATSVEISGLDSTVEYQYQVAAVAMLDGKEFEGGRSSSSTFTINSGGGGNAGVVIGVVVAILILVLVVGVVLVVIFLLWLRRRNEANKKYSSGGQSSGVSTVRYAKTTGQPLIQDVIEPRIDDFPEDTVAVEGEGVVFKVVVSGKPVPTLTWYHDDVEITTGYSQEVLDDGSLNIPSAELKQSGVYKLLARNSAGSVQQQVKLTVQIEKDQTPDFGGAAMTFEPVAVAEFGDYVAKNHGNNNQGFRDQFNALESGDHYAKTIGLSSEYKKMNRFANITNYDHNRIVLKPLQGHPDCTNEFINGCYIDGYSLPKKFIATQGPTPKTMVDFWRLIWQEKPPTIVMVTNLKENNKKKCEQYWPESGTGHFGPFKVTLSENQIFADYCIRTMQVTVEGTTRPHKLKQFHFTAWPDHGVPDYATPMLAFHRRIASTHNHRRGPMLVHCSAGVGRTGTFICIDGVLEQIKKENVVDIAGTINKMRHQRMKMVQTPEQYCFLHDAMLESVTCGDTQIAAADLRMKIAKYQKTDPTTGQTTFQSQFDVLEQVSPKLSEVICKVATQHPNRNRNTSYLPPDRYRVILKGEQPDYIHASFAHGYKHQKAYMIAEGPMSSTTRNMLKLLYDRKCGVVVMLSGLQEDGRESCFQYWPAVGAMSTQGEYTVDLISEEVLEGFTIRKISILEQRSQKAHQVTQFHITCWSPDGHCSNLRSVVDVIDEMEKVQRRTGNKPVFVHCSDTVTRSGMFCAMATVIDRCKTEGVVDVFQVVKALRIQRPGAVPTVQNYKILFDATLTFLDSFDTYANFQNV